MSNNKIFKTGMIYRSKTHPQFDLIIGFVEYNPNRLSDYGNIVCWCNINRSEFEKFIDMKLGKNKTSTFPYVYAGECNIYSMKQRIKKYNLEYVGMSDDEVNIYNDEEDMFSSGFSNMHSELTK